MIDFYTYNTFNGQAVAMALEEMQLEYRLIVVDLVKKEHLNPEFLMLNPSGRIPVVVDHCGEKPLVISQTGAILIYLAEKTGCLLPKNIIHKAKVLEMLLFQLTDISTNLFNNFYLKSLVTPKQTTAGDMMKQRAITFYSVVDFELSKHSYLGSNELSIADLACFPVVERLQKEESIQSLTHLQRWYKIMKNRPGVLSATNKLAVA
jgi:GST-like protein